jgi:hypothetical protein
VSSSQKREFSASDSLDESQHTDPGRVCQSVIHTTREKKSRDSERTEAETEKSARPAVKECVWAPRAVVMSRNHWHCIVGNAASVARGAALAMQSRALTCMLPVP